MRHVFGHQRAEPLRQIEFPCRGISGVIAFLAKGHQHNVTAPGMPGMICGCIHQCLANALTVKGRVNAHPPDFQRSAEMQAQRRHADTFAAVSESPQTGQPRRARNITRIRLGQAEPIGQKAGQPGTGSTSLLRV